MAAMVLLCARGRAQREAVAVAPGGSASGAVRVAAEGEADSVDTVLRGMARRAGVIFTGTVVEVRRRPAADGGGAGVVEVEFAVDRGVRGGAGTGGRYVLREWGGLWEGTDERYRVGQRLLMLLHAPGASGLSSPVSGMDGAIPLLAGASATAEPMVDLRWVAARVSRGPVRYRAETPRTPRARTMAEERHSPGSVTAEEVVPTAFLPGSSTAAACASVSAVLEAISASGGASQ